MRCGEINGNKIQQWQYIEMKHIAHYNQHMEYKQIWRPEKTFYGKIYISFSRSVYHIKYKIKIHTKIQKYTQYIIAYEEIERSQRKFCSHVLFCCGWRSFVCTMVMCNFFTFYSATLLRYDISWNEQTNARTNTKKNTKQEITCVCAETKMMNTFHLIAANQQQQ